MKNSQVQLVVFFSPKIKVSRSSLRNYTGDTELYAHAILRTRRYAPDFFCGSFLVVFVFNILPCLCLAVLWTPAGNGLTSRRFCMCRVHVVLSHSYKMSWVRCGT